MTLTDRDYRILRYHLRYFYLRASHLRTLVAPHDNDGSIVRARLRKMLTAGYVRRYEPKLADPNHGLAPIYAATVKGANALLAKTGDPSVALSVEPTFADWMSMNHYCTLSSLHIHLDALFAAQEVVTQHALYFEHEVVRAQATNPSERYRLHSTISVEPRVLCCPDSAFETELAGYRRAWYVEYETGSDNPARAAAKKFKGYAGLQRTEQYRRHFPAARDFRVLAVCPNAGWRDSMRKEVGTKDGRELWLFVALDDLLRMTSLHDPVWHTVDRGPLPLVPPPRPLPSPPAETRADGVAEGVTA